MLPMRKVVRRACSRFARRSNVGKWDWSYRDIAEPSGYGDDTTYRLGATFLEGLSLEDWGCGVGGMRRFVDPALYRGIDGSRSRFADEVVDLAVYRSDVDAVFLRHVLEHNRQWRAVLDNALASFRKRMVLVLFTPFSDSTHEIAFNLEFGVPDLSFAKHDLMSRFPTDVIVTVEEDIATNSQYKVEHVFYMARADA